MRVTLSAIRRAVAASGEATYRCAVSLSAGASSARGDELALILAGPLLQSKMRWCGATVVGAGGAAGQMLRDGYEGKNYYLQT